MITYLKMLNQFWGLFSLKCEIDRILFNQSNFTILFKVFDPVRGTNLAILNIYILLGKLLLFKLVVTAAKIKH